MGNSEPSPLLSSQEFEIELEGSQSLRILCYEKCYDKTKVNKDNNEIVDKIMGKGQIQVRGREAPEALFTIWKGHTRLWSSSELLWIFGLETTFSSPQSLCASVPRLSHLLCDTQCSYSAPEGRSCLISSQSRIMNTAFMFVLVVFRLGVAQYCRTERHM